MTKKSLSEMVRTQTNASSPITRINSTEVKIDLDFVKKQNIFFATPCYGGMLTDQYFLSMFKAQQHLMSIGLPFRITTLRNESLITRARNILAAMFLDSDCSHLMFIDADIEFEAESIVRMLAMDKDIIAGAYPKKTLLSDYSVDYAINLKYTDPQNKKVNIDNGAVEVLDASTGFFMIKRNVFEQLIIHYPELHYLNDSSIPKSLNRNCFAFFDTHLDRESNRYLSEDYAFCRLWQNIGGQIWLDPNTKLNHIGSYTFQGDVSKIFTWKQNPN